MIGTVDTTMTAIEIRDPEKDLVVSFYDLLEPREGLPEVGKDEIDFAVIPCVSCDHAGNRMGHGRGYYDRYLPLCTNAVRMIAAFEVQRTDLIYTEETDCAANVLVTEAGVLPAETEENAL